MNENQRGAVVWLTGLPASGKSTVAAALKRRLLEQGIPCYVIESEEIRKGMNRHLSFSPEDRMENIRRIGYLAAYLADASLIAIVAAISPYRECRQQARSLVQKGRFFEVHIDTPLSECESRDTKGLYKAARLGQRTEVTGIDAPYERPETPDLRIRTTSMSLDHAVTEILALLM